MGLTVERDGTLTLAAPPHCPTERLIKFAKSKTYWVYTQIAKRDLLRRPHDEKSFVTGEGFGYRDCPTAGHTHRDFVPSTCNF